MSSQNVQTNKLRYLKMKKPYRAQSANQCTLFMAELFNCWAGSGLNAVDCQPLEIKMKDCFDNRKFQPLIRTPFNYHAARLFPKLSKRPHD
ncbi:uncharacterized protein V1513DRAFT_454752 [Lipomyces chichibuensis]|uniref:uncharacterized protein n=1 Tax=Lipomyces chichibuensis TaxID=1546026 RepID=UPI0033430B7D